LNHNNRVNEASNAGITLTVVSVHISIAQYPCEQVHCSRGIVFHGGHFRTSGLTDRCRRS
jgi:hypothetical protein